ncbi:Alpha-2-macroglobulin receptor-associated protein [Saguinus oedipus]|uniref:Alpha-2-macroglobulin receptor-associated protein n=1 Tax=Saguinus oedipus TaxID=9490 RepID=A0ABQ9W1U4_SAGOE|nr:Alpha-2-macroglobulin receptor-associated protein [Saguinus oedipus]
MGPALGFTEVHENVISPSDLSDIKGNVLHSRHMELKERLHSINQGLDRLRRLSHQGYDTEAGECLERRAPGPVGTAEALSVLSTQAWSQEFEEPRVIDLWDLAQSANLTEKELQALRVQRQPQQKHRYVQGQSPMQRRHSPWTWGQARNELEVPRRAMGRLRAAEEAQDPSLCLR